MRQQQPNLQEGVSDPTQIHELGPCCDNVLYDALKTLRKYGPRTHGIFDKYTEHKEYRYSYDKNSRTDDRTSTATLL